MERYRDEKKEKVEEKRYRIELQQKMITKVMREKRKQLDEKDRSIEKSIKKTKDLQDTDVRRL